MEVPTRKVEVHGSEVGLCCGGPRRWDGGFRQEEGKGVTALFLELSGLIHGVEVLYSRKKKKM